MRAVPCWPARCCPMPPSDTAAPISWSWSPRRSGAIDSISTGRAAMRPSASALTELAANFWPRQRSADDAPIALAPPSAAGRSSESLSQATPRHRAAPKEIDGGLYLFALCKQLQATSLERRGIDCLIEADHVGRLPEPACRMLGLMVCDLVKDAGRRTHSEIPRPTITVSLQRRGSTCLCTVSHRGLGDWPVAAESGLQRVLRFAADSHRSFMVRSMPDRRTTAIMFEAHAVHEWVPEALSRYRLDAPWRRA